MPDEWYYAVDRRQHGPVTAGELRRLAAAGSLGPKDLVWAEGMAAWQPARTVAGLLPPGRARAIGPRSVDTPLPSVAGTSEVPPHAPTAPGVGRQGVAAEALPLLRSAGQLWRGASHRTRVRVAGAGAAFGIVFLIAVCAFPVVVISGGLGGGRAPAFRPGTAHRDSDGGAGRTPESGNAKVADAGVAAPEPGGGDTRRGGRSGPGVPPADPGGQRHTVKVKTGTLSSQTVVVELSRDAAGAGYRIADCSGTKGQVSHLTGKVTATARPLNVPGLQFHAYDKDGGKLATGNVHAPALDPGESGTFRVMIVNDFPKVSRVVLDTF